MSPHPPSDPTTLAHVQFFHSTRLTSSPIYTFLLSSTTLIYASKGTIRARLQLSHNHLNSHSSLHGSVSATIVDWAGGLAIAAYDLRDKTGVSTDIHVSYLGTAREGEVVEIEAQVDKVGKRMAFTNVTIRKVVEGKEEAEWPVVAKGSHTKFLSG
ncbi:Thioesterase/thiol ester dehydrase-isomerase [Westerdykella ornata]|uniref:Thioesterase/thiol ester dehydrase-isomerase n=1 Tax=Westerdykella ornata TaxID=318751 RepID=A0A6A6J753_WESOR|nr:Thioesterase/thiol ester dehydrase-isomerase [Westerdykella ornata]KAF2272225.1 Thioesterase/thiol ester dehydrase-isomerase [Westerdykella ornata]